MEKNEIKIKLLKELVSDLGKVIEELEQKKICIEHIELIRLNSVDNERTFEYSITDRRIKIVCIDHVE